MHLWEAKHPSYMEVGNFYKRGNHETFSSIDDFLDYYGNGVYPDLTLLIRWDWTEDREPTSMNHVNATFTCHFVNTGKAILSSTEAPVSRADEPRVRKFLAPFADHMVTIWHPLIKTGPGDGSSHPTRGMTEKELPFGHPSAEESLCTAMAAVLATPNWWELAEAQAGAIGAAAADGNLLPQSIIEKFRVLRVQRGLSPIAKI